MKLKEHMYDNFLATLLLDNFAQLLFFELFFPVIFINFDLNQL